MLHARDERHHTKQENARCGLGSEPHETANAKLASPGAGYSSSARGLLYSGLADVDLATAFVRPRNAVSWVTCDNTCRLHDTRPYAGRDGSAIGCWSKRTSFPGFHQRASL